MYKEIPFVEHAMLLGVDENITDSRLPTPKGQDWLRDIWDERLIAIQIRNNFDETYNLSANWYDHSNKSFSFRSDDGRKLIELIDALRKSRNRHIHFTGFTEQTNYAVMRSLKEFITNEFQNYDETCSKMRSALVCNPWQIFFDKYPVYYNGVKWTIDINKVENCGFSTIC